MSKLLKKAFGGLKLTWPRVIIAAVAAGVFTAAMAIIPGLHDTSFIAITVTFEVWILFGILIIMNSRSNLDSALKCFVFFLISQPLVYLLQVPFSRLGWGLFGYYKYWFIWTVLCLPMGFVGYYMKKGRWWGYLILLPMILLTASSYRTYFSDFLFSRPRFILISLSCICMMLLYPLAIFEKKTIRAVGAAVSAVAIAGVTILCLLRPPVYSTEIMGNGDQYAFDDSYSVHLADGSFGDVEIRYFDSIDDYMVHAEFRKAGKTVLTLEAPNGEKTEYDLSIERDRFEVSKR